MKSGRWWRQEDAAEEGGSLVVEKALLSQPQPFLDNEDKALEQSATRSKRLQLSIDMLPTLPSSRDDLVSRMRAHPSSVLARYSRTAAAIPLQQQLPAPIPSDPADEIFAAPCLKRRGRRMREEIEICSVRTWFDTFGRLSSRLCGHATDELGAREGARSVEEQGKRSTCGGVT